jgi:hypothetical protein
MLEMNSLFEEWKLLVSEESDHFVEDGIISEADWIVASKKVLFILKETNGYEKSISALIKNAVTKNPKSGLWDRPTFHNVGRWAHGLIQNSSAVTSYNDSHVKRKESLLSCAFMNLKKTSGGRTATKAVSDFADRYSELIRRQIDLISPEIIVFGGTYKIVKKYVIPEMERVSSRVHRYNKIICINANHPACIKNRKYLYEQVIGSYNSYLALANDEK